MTIPPKPDYQYNADTLIQNIPDELKKRTQWLIWKWVWNAKRSKWDKVPHSPFSGDKCNANDILQHVDFDTALVAAKKHLATGIGIAPGNSIVIIDLDNVIIDGCISAQALEVIERFKKCAYIETTPSGIGKRIVIEADTVNTFEGKRNFPEGSGLKGEVYISAGYCTITGNRHGTGSIMEYCNGAFSEWVKGIWATQDNVSQEDEATPRGFSGFQLLLAQKDIKTLAAKDKGFDKLCQGDASAYQRNRDGYSEAMQGLTKDLLRLTKGNIALTKYLYEHSGLYECTRDKWDRRWKDEISKAAQQVAEEYASSSEQSRSWLTEDELDNLPNPNWLLPDYIVAGEIATMYAPSGTGKTFLALDWALTVAQQDNVMHCALEDVNGIKIRKHAWKVYHKKTAKNFYVWNDDLNISNTQAVDDFIQQVSGLNLKLIIIDTLALAMAVSGGDENSTRDMGLAIRGVKAIQRATGAAILIIHHTPVSDTERERGNGALRAASYTMLGLTQKDGILTLKNTKAKNSTPFKPKQFKLEPVGNSAVTVPTYQFNFKPVQGHIRTALETIARLESLGKAASFTNIRATGCLSENAASNALKALEADAYALKGSGKRGLYSLTEKGRAEVSAGG